MIHDFFDEAITLANSCPPLSHDDYTRVEETISKEFKWYLIGLTCWLSNKKRFHSDELNDRITREQIAESSGNSVETMKRYMCYANSIDRVKKALPELASDILAGKTRLGLKTAIILAKLPPEDIAAITRRVEAESTPIRRIIEEQIKRPTSYPRRFADGRSTKSSPKSVKDAPRYDPDAQVAALTYTIPSWVKAIDRLHASGNLHEASKPARKKLGNELANLKITVEALIELITEAL